jgi:ABC-type branched-subunit amino acid transport system ATPase component
MLLRVSDLYAGYGDIVILRGVDLELDAGSMIAILGPNGIGKSTLLKTLAGLLPVRRGNVMLSAKDITHTPTSSRARLGIGYVPQGREIFAKLTVLENLLVGIQAMGLPRRIEMKFIGRVDQHAPDAAVDPPRLGS